MALDLGDDEADRAVSEAAVVDAVSPVVAPVAEPPGTFAAFAIRPFRLLWLNTFLFSLVQSTQRFTFVWLVLELGRGANASGLVLFAIGLPVFLVVLPAGALADRVDRRTQLMCSQGGSFVFTALTAVLVAIDAVTLPVALVLAAAIGTSLAFGQPVRTAVVPSLVPRERLMNAIVLTTIGINMSMIAGPAIGGLAISVAGVAGAFAVQALLFAVGLVALIPLRLPPIESPPARRGLRVDIGEGLRFVAHHREIRALFILIASSGILMMGPYQALMPQIAREELGQGAFRTSLLFVFLGLGMASTSLFLASRRDFGHKGAWFASGLVVGGLVQVGLGLSPVYPLTAGLMFIWGVGGGVFLNLNQTLIQTHTPHEVMGRVMGLHTLAMLGVAPMGALAGGAVAGALGAPRTVAGAGLTMSLIAVTVLVRVGTLRRMR